MESESELRGAIECAAVTVGVVAVTVLSGLSAGRSLSSSLGQITVSSWVETIVASSSSPAVRDDDDLPLFYSREQWLP